jgi:enoyl-CoA hydratase/carnithine racemase
MSDVACAFDGTTAIITLNRPQKLNAITPDMLAALEKGVRAAEDASNVRCLVLRAEGKAFSVGADINIWSSLTPEAFRRRWIDGGHHAFDAIARCRLPVIAALQGMAFGGGLELALAADMRVAEEDCLLALPEVSLGTVPGWGGTQRLPEIVGKPRAKQMILSAARIPAPQAEAWGLVNVMCQTGHATARAMALADEIGGFAPISVQLAKKLINASTGDGRSATLEMLAGVATLTTNDLVEGISALREKRRPNFAGT